MKISVFSALYPPQVIGGAELVTQALNRQLAMRGHEINVLTTGAPDHHATFKDVDGVRIKRIKLHRPYQAYEYANRPVLQRLGWHLLDHVSPENTHQWTQFLAETQPDIAMVQVTQGLGFNGLRALAKPGLPSVYVIHDLSLACIKTNMFRDEANCSGQCSDCKISRSLKVRNLPPPQQMTFISPSQAIYDKVSAFIDLKSYPHVVMRNPVHYDAFDHIPSDKGQLRLMYAGQISANKGVDFLLSAFSQLKANGSSASLTIVGSGPDLPKLRDLYASIPDLAFTGKVAMSEVSQIMARHDALCVPSLWFENSPGVIAQAIVCNLPVLASRIGGIPELIEDNINGRLLEPGNLDDWLQCFKQIDEQPSHLQTWRDNNRHMAPNFTVSALVDNYEQLLLKKIETQV